MPGTLFVVATPLGNLADASPHVARCLADAGLLYAEDTRRSRILLEHFGIDKPLKSLNAHNERSRTEEILNALAQGVHVALVTDAGTPAVSDPGSDIVSSAHDAGYTVSPVSGPSALSTAVSVAGFSAAHVLFVGFLPVKGQERKDTLLQIDAFKDVVVMFEAPHRFVETMRDLANMQPHRVLCMCRELTKMHEEIKRKTVSEWLQWAQDNEVRGEFTWVLGPSLKPKETPEEANVEAALKRCLSAGMSVRDAAAAVSLILEQSKKDVYARALLLAKAE